MTPARHDRLFAAAFAAYTSVLVRRRLSAVWTRGALSPTRSPLVVAAQHVGWWDPMVLFHLSRSRFTGTHYTMMEEANMRRFGFFRRLGAFGVDRESRAGTLASMRYALARLAEPGARVWVFPQGRLAPSDARPIACDPGAEWLAARSRAPVVAVAIRYDFLEDEFPQAFVSFSEPRSLSGEPGEVARMLTDEADGLRDAVAARDGSLELAARGRRSRRDALARALSCR